MKATVYLFAILFSTGVFAQSNFYTTVMDNSDGDAIYLETTPWDQTQLIQVSRVFNQNTNSNDFYLFGILNGVSSLISVPSCSAIKSKPTFLDDGILVNGVTSSGVECMFFDGTSTTVYDLNPGLGNSDPTIHILDDRIFVIAHNGATEQLYEFDKLAHNLTNITFGNSSVFDVCAIWGDAIYFSTRDYNSATAGIDFKLVKADVAGGSPSFSTIRTISLPLNPAKSVYWSFPQIKWGKLYLTEDVYSLVASETSDLGVVSIDQNDQVTEVHQTPQVDNQLSQLFEWNNALWTYGGSSYQLYKSVDGISFSQDLDLGSKSIRDYFISETDKLYFTMNTSSPSVDEISLYDGSLQTVGTGKILNFLLEENGVVYLSNLNLPDSSSIVLLHTDSDVIDEVKIASTPFSILSDATLMFENEFTFIFKFGQSDSDVLKLTGSPSASIKEQEENIGIFPNPISQGQTIFVESKNRGVAQILSSDGKLVKSLEVVPGVNEIETSSMNSGVYILSFENRAHRIVVN